MRDLYSTYLDHVLPKPTVQLRRRTLIGLAAGAAVTVSWAAGVTWYVASRDELAQRFFSLETEMKVAYEDRIGQLSVRLERETTQNLNAISGKLDQGGAGALLGGQRLPDYEPGKQNNGKK